MLAFSITFVTNYAGNTEI